MTITLDLNQTEQKFLRALLTHFLASNNNPEQNERQFALKILNQLIDKKEQNHA